MKKLWYKSPAERFEQAVPLGNGRLGAMHYAGVKCDKISLNEDTLWSGFPRSKAPEAPYNHILKASKLLRQGKVNEAENIINNNCLGEWTEAYQPAGNLFIKLNNIGEYSNYNRELDLKSAVSSSTFDCAGHRYIREFICTAADNVMIYYFKTDSDKNEAEILIESPHPNKVCLDNGILMMRSIAPSYAAPINLDCENPIRYDSFENNRALSYCVGIKPVLLNGKYDFKGDRVTINSTEFYLIIDIATNFTGFDVAPVDSKIDEYDLCKQRLSNAVNFNFDELKKRHFFDYNSLFNRVELFIEGENFENVPTDERLVAYREQKNDVSLVTLMYDYARYLTIASSRENTQATNLQGIWNEHVRPAWSSNYTLNINTEMNYWHVERSNLSECHMPLINLIRALSKNGTKTAAEYYNAKGWVAHHNSDIWCHSTPVGKGGANLPLRYSFWNMSGCWLACHIWEHYSYTGDIAFLQEYYPYVKGATEFLMDWMVTDDEGYFITPITTSPENFYLLNGEKHALSRGSAMDRAIASELFNCYINASNELSLDREFADSVKNVLLKLKPYGIDNENGILEWNEPFEEQDPRHRHISSLWGLYPGNDINSNTPQLEAATKKVLDRKGNDSTGWAIVWRICCWSRLGDGNRVKELIDNIFRLSHRTDIGVGSGGGVYPNLLIAHPPFQIDGNFGFAAGINEMLLRTIDGEIIPLPALPDAWKKGGYVKGLKIVGNRTVEIEWKNGEIIKFKIN